LSGSAAGCHVAHAEPFAAVGEFEYTLSKSQPLQGYLRRPNSADQSIAVLRDFLDATIGRREQVK
jgi:hypothetical protein